MSERQRKAKTARRRHHASVSRAVATSAVIGLAAPTAADAVTYSASQVQNINHVAAGSGPHAVTAVGSTRFFVAYQAGSGSELWATDGTSTGTTLVKDIVSGPS